VQAGGFADAFRNFILGSEAQARVALSSHDLDHAAAECMGCHQGHIQLRTAGSPLVIRGSQTLNHPVGMRYADSVRHDPQGYRTVASLNSNIQLVDGKVTCLSCHEKKATPADTLIEARLDTAASRCTASGAYTVGTRDKELCLSCHIK
jgi:hypothetical protein